MKKRRFYFKNSAEIFVNHYKTHLDSFSGLSKVENTFGTASFGFAQIGQIVGQNIGYALSGMTHLSSGANIASTFGLTSTMLAKAGFIAGGMVGSAIGGMAANHAANKMVGDTFGSRYKVDNPNYVRSGLLKFFQWMYPFV